MKNTKKILQILLVIIVFLLIGVVGYFVFIRNKTTPQTQKTSFKPSSVTEDNEPKRSLQTEKFDKKKYSLSDPNSIWVVVNKSRALNPMNYAPDDLVNVGNGQLMRKSAGDSLQSLLKDATNEGVSLQPLSGYRAYATQQTVYAKEVANYGQTVADSQSAKPGHSEHQTGLSIDMGGGGCGIEDCFGNTAEGKWLAANAYKYGFIIRYPNGKESITGYRYEPWHIRYVGKDLASEMQNNNITTMEEFFNL